MGDTVSRRWLLSEQPVDLGRERRMGAFDAGPPVCTDKVVEVELEQASEVGLERWPSGFRADLAPRRASVAWSTAYAAT